MAKKKAEQEITNSKLKVKEEKSSSEKKGSKKPVSKEKKPEEPKLDENKINEIQEAFDQSETDEEEIKTLIKNITDDCLSGIAKTADMKIDGALLLDFILPKFILGEPEMEAFIKKIGVSDVEIRDLKISLIRNGYNADLIAKREEEKAKEEKDE